MFSPSRSSRTARSGSPWQAAAGSPAPKSLEILVAAYLSARESGRVALPLEY
jgi:hypothetical protein